MLAILFLALCGVTGYLVATSVFDILTGHRSAREIHHHHYYIDNRSVTLVQGPHPTADGLPKRYKGANIKPDKRTIREL